MIIARCAPATSSAPIAWTSGPIVRHRGRSARASLVRRRGAPTRSATSTARPAARWARALASKRVHAASPFELFFTPVGRRWRGSVVVAAHRRGRAVGVQHRPGATPGHGMPALAARQRRIGRACVRVPRRGVSPTTTLGRFAQGAAEGLTLGGVHTAGTYKTAEPAPAAACRPGRSSPEGRRPESLGDRVARGQVLGECSNLARALTNEPGKR